MPQTLIAMSSLKCLPQTLRDFLWLLDGLAVFPQHWRKVWRKAFVIDVNVGFAVAYAERKCDCNENNSLACKNKRRVTVAGESAWRRSMFINSFCFFGSSSRRLWAAASLSLSHSPSHTQDILCSWLIFCNFIIDRSGRELSHALGWLHVEFRLSQQQAQRERR